MATLYPDGGPVTAEALIGRADRHLYNARQGGRNQVCGAAGGDPATRAGP